MKIVFATGNKHKLQEINEIVSKYRHCGLDPQSQGCAINNNIEFILPPEGFNPIENGETFEENSLIKAREAARLSGMIALADDSGLCVDALGGAPGIHSARYAQNPQARIDKLLKELDKCERRSVPDTESQNRGYNAIADRTSFVRNDASPNRRAKFVCAMTLVDSDGEILFQTRGECHGEIAREQSGVNGFGYDPVFIVDGTSQSMAQMSEEDKNEISHRGKALREVLKYLSK